jgi:hypothetical protein
MMASRSTHAGWMVSPAFDLLFVANLTWLLALLPGYLAASGMPHIEFWQLYFLTTPHRWITLLLVAIDPDRRDGRPWLFVSLALVALAVVAGVYLCVGGFLCLLLVDYLWNGWHFASQHAGVLRIYSRKQGGGWVWLERYGVRLFVCYVIARTAGWTTGWLEAWPTAMAWVLRLDWLLLGLPATLLLAEFRDFRLRLPKLAYLASVCGLYSALLLALHFGHRPLILSLTTASALFHATEYLAIVSHYAQRRQHDGSPGLFQSLARHWLLFLACYLSLLGLLAALLQSNELLSTWTDPSTASQLTTIWLGMNIWAAFLHYAYDGLIWKLRRPQTARALGAEPMPT